MPSYSGDLFAILHLLVISLLMPSLPLIRISLFTHPHTPSLLNPTQCDDPGNIINLDILCNVLDLDDDDTHEWSKSVAWDYFLQAHQTILKMERSLYVRPQPPDVSSSLDHHLSAEKDLPQLSFLAQFLKGSSATLGVSKVKVSCEQLEQYGSLRNQGIDRDLSLEVALVKIDRVLKCIKVECTAAESWFKEYYKFLDAGTRGDSRES